MTPCNTQGSTPGLSEPPSAAYNYTNDGGGGGSAAFANAAAPAPRLHGHKVGVERRSSLAQHFCQGGDASVRHAAAAPVPAAVSKVGLHPMLHVLWLRGSRTGMCKNEAGGD